MLNMRLPSPLFMPGVGSLPLASIVSWLAPGPMIDSASVIASSPSVSKIVAGPPLVSDGSKRDRICRQDAAPGQLGRLAQRQVA